MRVLVTGGAGYIGSVTSAQLLAAGHQVRILDDLSTGHRAAVPDQAELVEASLTDSSSRSGALDDIDAVIHFASRSLVGESIDHPLEYFQANVGGALLLLGAMADAGVRRMVFSSSAAVYGEPAVELIDESTPLVPINPYGLTKMMIERVLIEQGRVQGLGSLSLRYFNACGADGPRGEDHRPETHLIPRICALAQGRAAFKIYGDDFDTPDGTCIRDYVHVEDLARAHVLALEHVESPGHRALNLGSGEGASVRDVLAVAADVAGRALDAAVGPRRPGDPPRLVASRARAGEVLGWEPRHDLRRIVSDAMAWHSAHPDGYRN